ncbi:molybdopterin molybdotransferase MoeA [Ketogulonicigenium vulgare]|uniref:molybdopterin molybdotransferase MoeA n=1 Tax=Ketogulonicigenium vulgare TaxID=92945 RepID=UPI00235986A6|nr:molybdopterin molybdotransferase MoeA [Ketogulonicigenium vulgare]
MISVAEALARVLALGAPLAPEEIDLDQGLGRVLAAPAVAQLDQPPFDTSSMDGYAVGAAATGDSLQVIGESAAGARFSGVLSAGEAVRIFTGAPLPAGALRVVPQEDVLRDGDHITITEDQSSLFVRTAGDDFRAGDTHFPRRPLRPADLGLLAAMNVPRLHVHRRARVAIIPGGDELVPPGGRPGPDQIIASGDLAIAAMVERAGAIALRQPIVPDHIDAIRAAFTAAADADVVVTIGGASVGDHDLIAPTARAMGAVIDFHRIALQPGKPLMAGTLGHQVFIGLPGNPVSAQICTLLFILPLLDVLRGLPGAAPKTARVRLAADLPANGKRQHYMRVTLTDEGALPVRSQESNLQSLMALADGVIIRPIGAGPAKCGEMVDYIAF